MHPETNDSSPIDDLAYIRKIMEETRKTVVLNGTGFIVWGLLLLLGLLGNWVLATADEPGWSIYSLWGAVVVVGWTFSLLHFRHKGKARRASNPAGRLMGGVWLSCSIAMVLMVFVGIPAGIVAPEATAGLCAAVVGIGVFLSGTLMGTPWVRNLAFGWWIGSAAAFIFRGALPILIFASLIVVLYLIPGIILNLQLRRSKTVGSR